MLQGFWVYLSIVGFVVLRIRMFCNFDEKSNKKMQNAIRLNSKCVFMFNLYVF